MSSPLDADKFISYLEARWRAFVEGEGNVDCQSCRGCCRAGYAIGLSKAEAAIIPHVVFEGHAVILPLPTGACPYLIDEKCSIYAHRPASCRQYDCRDFAMASLRLNPADGSHDQVLGVDEINRSIERFAAENEGIASTYMSNISADLVGKQGHNAVVAAQHSLVAAIMSTAPPERGKSLMDVLLSVDEAERGAGMVVADRVREAQRGQPS